VAIRTKFLEEYQSRAYAQRYVALVERAREVERRAFPGRTSLAQAVARYYFKLLAIKDEYEVARLHVHSGFLEKISQQFEGGYKLVFNLAPPLLSGFDRVNGEPRKREFGAWIVPVFRALAALRVLRGTAFDIFGYTKERRLDRRLLGRYEANMQAAMSMLETGKSAQSYRAVVELACLPEKIRGYGHVRARSIEAVRERESVLLNLIFGGRPDVPPDGSSAGS
jgi:indolepyruvate ferredoxin oxidoreductase